MKKLKIKRINITGKNHQNNTILDRSKFYNCLKDCLISLSQGNLHLIREQKVPIEHQRCEIIDKLAYSNFMSTRICFAGNVPNSKANCGAKVGNSLKTIVVFSLTRFL